MDATGIGLHVVAAGTNRQHEPLLGPTIAGLDPLRPDSVDTPVHLYRVDDSVVSRPLLAEFGDVFGIAKGTENKDMALDFIRFYLTKEVQEQLIAQIGWAPTRADALGQVEEWQQPYFETVTEALEFTQPRPSVAYWIDVENILTNAFNDVVTNEADVAETLERYQGEIDALANGG